MIYTKAFFCWGASSRNDRIRGNGTFIACRLRQLLTEQVRSSGKASADIHPGTTSYFGGMFLVGLSSALFLASLYIAILR